MAENYIKPQSPLKKINKETGEVNYIYPITTPDQVVMEDGRRLNVVLDELSENPDIDLSKHGIITIDLEGSTEGTVAGIDADTFQGYSIDKFVMYNVGGGEGEDVPFIEATSGVSIDLESAEESGQPATVDADTLGGYPAKYFLENAGGGSGDVTVNLDGAETSGQASTVNADLLGSIPASGYVKKSELDTSNMDLLWENTSPDSDFNEQSITIPNLTNYTHYEILCKQSKTDERYITFKSKVGLGTLLYNVAGYNKEIYSRNVTVDSADPTILNIATCYQGTTHYDNCLIPYQIYGIKDTSIVSGGAGGISSGGNADTLGGKPASDYVTKAELEDKELELLWENTNLTTSFAGTTVNVSNEYNKYLVVAKNTDSGSAYDSMEVLPDGRNYTLKSGATKSRCCRNVSISDGVVTFGNGLEQTTYGDAFATANDKMLPTAVYGIKESSVASGGMDLLWENSNPTTDFVSQTVALDLSNYRFVEIEFQVTSNSGNQIFKGSVGTKMWCAAAQYSSSNGTSLTMYRPATVNTEGIEFSYGVYSTDIGVTKNNCMIPLRIYGIK